MSRKKESPVNNSPSVRRGTLASLRAEACAGCGRMKSCRTWDQFYLCRCGGVIGRNKQFDLLGIPKIIRKDRGRAPQMQSKVYAMLLRGKQTAGDLSAALRVADPRGHIRDLRAKGINIADEWVKSAEGVLYKRYWITKEVTV